MRAAGRPPGSTRHAAAAVLAAGLALAGCGPGGAAPDDAGAATTPPPASVETKLTPAQNVDISLVGTWWALAAEVPYQGLRLQLIETDDPAAWEGSWISFDWRASDNETVLERSSRPVAITAHRSPDGFLVRGPVPQIDVDGQPNGGQGRLELALRLASLPGEPLRLAGRMLHSDMEDEDGAGVGVELLGQFRPWRPAPAAAPR